MSAADNLYAELTRGVAHAQVRQHLIDEHRAEVLADFVDRCAIALSGCCPECDAAVAIVRGRVQPAMDGAPVPERTEPLIVRRFDTSIEPDRECGETEMVVCCIAEGGRPVALLLDDEARDKLAGLLGLGKGTGTTGGEPTPAAGFFKAGRTYTDGTGYTAPELTTCFHVEHVTRHPASGQLRAIGWSRSLAPDARWHGDFRDEDEFTGWTELDAPLLTGGDR